MKSLIHLAFVLVFVLSGSIPVLAGQADSVPDFSCADVTEIPISECEALVALYNSTNGAGWTNHTNWLVTNTPSNWVGVTVASGHVNRLNISSNNMVGSIPPELGNLTNLGSLDLYENRLSGSIPAELGNLTNLTWLDFGSNQLSSNIPAELGNLTNLIWLFLSSNQLSGSIPAKFGNLTSLRDLGLTRNQLSGSIPSELGNLASLEFLFLGSNQLSGSIPSELGNLIALNELDISNNFDLIGPLPTSLTSLTLYRFSFNNTGLCEPNDPAFQSWLSSIQVLQRTGVLCQTCAVVSEIPLTECQALVALYDSTDGYEWLDHTNWLFTYTPSDWFGVSVESGHVNSLNISSNNMVGSIPPELGNLTNLTYMNLSHNKLSGSIPTELSNLTQLGALKLKDNQLSGSIPAELGNLTNLLWLGLEVNQLSGSIPPELGNLTNLEDMDLNDNQLSGSIPAELGNLTNLLWLGLDVNRLSGSIPAELGDLTRINHLDLGNNHLSGSIPPELSKMTSLTYLNLGANQLSGSIPPELGDLAALKVLWLQDNLLEGDIPLSLSYLTNLFDPGLSYGGNDGLDLDYNLLNIPSNYPDPGEPLQVFLSQKDPDWQLYQALELVIGAEGGELTSLDGRTDFVIPAGAVITDTSFTFIPKLTPHHSSGRLAFLHNSFELTAEDAGGNPVTVFNLPITVTLTYTDADFAAIAEDTLGLYYWDDTSSNWTDAVSTCPGGAYTRDLEGNMLALPLCHLTEFGLFGNPLNIFLPVVRR
jgi:Leucine-rich repeat (LRR) protein